MSLHQPQKHPGKITGTAPRVSVIIPTMNRPDYLAVALDSLRRQTFKDFEVVIVNDAGEAPLPVIEAFAECLNILYLSHETNQGPAAARNTALRAARGRLIAYLDDDDFYYEDHLEILVKAIQKSGAAVVYSDANWTTQYLENGRLVTRSRRVLYSVDFDPQKLLVGNISPPLCFMHEKHCLNEVGYFREYLPPHEDWDFWMRLSRFYTFYHLPCTTCEYVWRKGDDTLSQDKNAMKVTGQYVGRIGKWLARVPRVEELYTRLGDARIACRVPNAVYELSVIVYMSGATPALEKCFAALGAALPDPGQTEIVLIADGAPELAQTLCQLAGEEMTVIEHPHPMGRTLAHNHAAKLAHGKRLLFLSPEVALDPQALAHMQAVGQEHGGPTLVTARLDANGTFCYGGRADAAGHVRPLRELSSDGQGIRQARVDCAPITCLLVPAAIFQLLGGFRRRYAPAFFEDADFCLRAANEFGIPTFCALDANAVLPAATGSEIYAPAARVNAVTFAADWGTSVRFGLDAPPAEWSTPFWPPQPPRITALMTVYNGEAYLKEAIDSILAQTLPEFVFLIVDDGSTDTAPAILEKYAGEDARVRIVTNEKNTGIAVSLNRGIELIDTPYIARMDADDITHPERFELQLAYMESHPEVAAVGCRIMLFHSENPQQGTAIWQVPTSPHIVRKCMYMKESCLSHPGSMLRTADIKAVGAYREQFRLAEDYDLWLRLLEKHELCNLPEILLLYRQHEASISGRCEKTQQRISHVLAMQSSEYRRQGKTDPIADKELTLELLLSLLDPSKPSAYMWVMFLTSDSVKNQGKLLYDILALILRNTANTGEEKETFDLLKEYLGFNRLQRIIEIFSTSPELRKEAEYNSVIHTFHSHYMDFLRSLDYPNIHKEDAGKRPSLAEYFDAYFNVAPEEGSQVFGTFMQAHRTQLAPDERIAIVKVLARNLLLDHLETELSHFAMNGNVLAQLDKSDIDLVHWMRTRMENRSKPPRISRKTSIVFAVMDYKMLDYDIASCNRGDYIQTLAALGHIARFSEVESSDEGGELSELLRELQNSMDTKKRIHDIKNRIHPIILDRDFASGRQYPEHTWLICNGWFMHGNYNGRVDFPFPSNIIPIMLSFHINNPRLLTDKAIAALHKVEPVGCRDWNTVRLLHKAGIRCFFSGCMTTTISQVFPEIRNAIPNKRLACVDVSVPEERYPDWKIDRFTHLHSSMREFSLVEGVRDARALLENYMNYEIIATSRLHCYLPCRALGLKTFFVPHNKNDIRFEGLIDISDASFVNMQLNIEHKMEAMLRTILTGNPPEKVLAIWRNLCADDVLATEHAMKNYFF